jgi:hypothetical protein
MANHFEPSVPKTKIKYDNENKLFSIEPDHSITVERKLTGRLSV